MIVKLARFLVATLLAILLVGSVYAYRVALKSGKVIEFQKYRTTENALLYADDQGREVIVPLDTIDLDRTRTLNSAETPALELPGMQTKDLSKTAEQQPSLGDLARKVTKGSGGSVKRVFTDDDVAHSGPRDAAAATPQQAAATFDDSEAFANLLAEKTARQLGELEAGEIQFPGRDKWETKLFDQKEKLVKATRTGVDAGRRYMQVLSEQGSKMSSPTPDEQLRIQEAKTALNGQISNIRTERYRFDQIVNEGVRAASEWKRAVDK
jgi:hypothetical protein